MPFTAPIAEPVVVNEATNAAHTAGLYAYPAFSPDGTRLVTAMTKGSGKRTYGHSIWCAALGRG